MASLSWQEAMDLIEPYIVRISTPTGSGTGFLFTYAGDGGVCGIATAGHVIAHAHDWESPIRIHHYKSGHSVLLTAGKRAIVVDSERDTAALVFAKGDFTFPEATLPLSPEGKYLRTGAEIGWVGFPGIVPGTLCFFSGRTSAMLQKERSYLVDGVAINGVSGGPAFFLDNDGKQWVVGVVSAYIPNRLTGDTLPGLCVIADVGQLQAVVKGFTSVASAQEEQTPPGASSAPPEPPPDTSPSPADGA